MKKGLGITAVLVAIAAVSFAQDATRRVDARQHQQRAHIREGRANGELTHREAARLNAEQGHIRRSERRAEADGKVTVAERMRLHNQQQRAHRDIRRQTHDGQSRPRPN